MREAERREGVELTGGAWRKGAYMYVGGYVHSCPCQAAPRVYVHRLVVASLKAVDTR